jgi:hypothetical protein
LACSRKQVLRREGPSGKEQRFFDQRDKRKLLKTLDPHKEIQAFSFDFLWPGLAGFGGIWPDFV